MRSALILCYGHVAAGAPRELLLARVEADLFWNMSECFSTKVGVFWVSQWLGALPCGGSVGMHFTPGSPHLRWSGFIQG